MGPDPARIVRFLLDRGITAMKIYPFSAPDHYLSSEALERGLNWIREIRDQAGRKMDICVDCWGRFDLAGAQRIARALEPYQIPYREGPMLMNNASAHARLAAETTGPISMSETLASRYEYREFFELKACDVVMYDIRWCGGPSEAKKISGMADTNFIATSPHTCGGPLLDFCSIHLPAALPNFLIMESNDRVWVRLHTDKGLVGTGESYPGHDAHVGALKELARFVLGKDATQIERLWQDLYYQISYRPVGGAEFRMITAINIAQGDILGQAAGMPVYKLLRSKAQERLRVYNTMNGWPIYGMRDHDAEQVTEFLLRRGIKAVKIHPYDRGPVNPYARHGGTFITQAELKQCLDPVQRIRRTAGDEMEIALDLSGKWNLPCSLQIARSLEPYGILYLEDPMLPDNLEAYATLARETSIPVSPGLGLEVRAEPLAAGEATVETIAAL